MYKAVLFLVVSFLLCSPSWAGESVLLLADIHFDPLADSSLIAKLMEEPVGQWDEIFQTSVKKGLSSYQSDTNYALWRSALAAMKQNVSDPSVVMVAGDFFRHTFHAEFEKQFKAKFGDDRNKMRAAYRQFLQKTIQFEVKGLTAQFPKAQFIPVVGNNESTCGDYMIYLRDPFLKDFADAWQSAAQQSIPKSMSSDFASSGHYSVSLHGRSKLRVIVGNNIFLTPQYNGRCGNSMVPPALGELKWLDQQLTAAEKAKEKVWLVTHVPPGVDVLRSLYKSVNSGDEKIWLMLKDDYNQKYLEMLHRHASNILFHFAAHNHFADFRLPKGEVAVWMMPSISADKTNNPSFQVLDFDAKNLKVENVTQYSLDLASSSPAWTKLMDFDSAFQQKELSLETLKATGEALKAGRFVSNYSKMQSSNGQMASSIASIASKGFICAITETDIAAYQSCYKR